MHDKHSGRRTRRAFLLRGGALVGAVITGRAAFAQAAGAASSAEVSPLEDLMREHGLLSRNLLIYDELRRRLVAGEPCPIEVLTGAAHIIRSFVEDYHEKLEENYLFPRFEKAGRLTDLVRVLLAQHQAGRRVTDLIRRDATSGLKTATARRRLAQRLRLFNRMYRPHKAREDTVLFPALHSIVSAQEYDALGDEFEKREQELFGAGGFEKMVARTADLEKVIGIYELSRFTPKV
jgi:hemerythrin-like domain-containing protein